MGLYVEMNHSQCTIDSRWPSARPECREAELSAGMEAKQCKKKILATEVDFFSNACACLRIGITLDNSLAI